MAEEIKTPASEVPPSIVETPEPPPPLKVEEKLYPDTPNGDPKPPVVEEPKTAAITPDPKAPTEPVKEPAKTDVPAAPVDLDLKLPENSPLTKEDLDSIAKDAKEKGLTKEQAEARLKTENDIAVRTAQRFQQQQEQSVKSEQAKWPEMIKLDPELGGEKYNETVTLASRAFKATASPELQEIIRKSGLGNHPEYVRQMAKFGRMMAEDTMIAGRSGAMPAAKSREERMYGATTPGADGKIPGA